MGEVSDSSLVLLFLPRKHMPTSDPKSYVIRKIARDLVLTGDGTSSLWKQGERLTDFSYPWETELPSTMCFRAVHSERWVYFLFDVEDRAVHVSVKDNHKLEAIDSSRVEIFFRKDQSLTPYYCLEIDAAGRVLDYIGNFHRRFDFNWSWPSRSLSVKASRHLRGYIVEAAVSKESLTALGLLSSGPAHLQAGLFRAVSTHTVAPRDHMRWVSWMHPNSVSPDFHIPSAFGVLHLAD